MKILIGVDTEGFYKATLNLASRLRFPDPAWTLAHSVDLTIPLTGYGMVSQAAYGAEFMQMAEETGKKAIHEAEQIAKAKGLNAETAMLRGGAAGALAQFAEDIHADLVGVHSERKGRLGSLFLGSVSRGLAIGAKQSLLVTKEEVAAEGSLGAVFATDHSEYAWKALDHFIAMAPKGIDRLKVISALHLSDRSVREYLEGTAQEPPIVERLYEEANRQTRDAVTKLQAAGFSCTGEVIDAPVDEAIAQGMKSIGADLVVMGAQGHGFTHRLLLGSTSLHQVVVEPHSVLIVRP